MNVHFSQESDEWATPQPLFDALNSEFKFTLDAAATSENAKCPRFYTQHDSGLDHSWEGERVFVNPPYDRELIPTFLEKAASYEAEIVVAVVPARTNTFWFHNRS
jgi:phage N-6-adenine-methyltransferase